jgi:hypothetical protein
MPTAVLKGGQLVITSVLSDQSGSALLARPTGSRSGPAQ